MFRHPSVTDVNAVVSVMEGGACGPVVGGLVAFISRALRCDGSKQAGGGAAGWP